MSLECSMTRCARRAAICRIKYELNSVSKQAPPKYMAEIYFCKYRTKTRVLNDKNVVLVTKIIKKLLEFTVADAKSNST